MVKPELLRQVRAAMESQPPLPGCGHTPERHRFLMNLGRRDLSLARLLEAHFDAVAILAAVGRSPEPGALYGVWASEKPGVSLRLSGSGGNLKIDGSKAFCSGLDIVDRVLVTVREPDELLLDVSLRANASRVRFDCSDWTTIAFAGTQTGSAHFHSAVVTKGEIVGPPRWYLERPGFWHGACGPAACWGGGAAGLFDYALAQSRDDPHTMAHLGAIQADVWAIDSYLDCAGREIDAAPFDTGLAMMRALRVRHLIEQASTGILRRFARAWGPYPLSMVEETARRYQELDLYLRQSHAERDLESLGRKLRRSEEDRHLPANVSSPRCKGS